VDLLRPFRRKSTIKGVLSQENTMHVITDPSLLSPEQQELILAATANRGMLQICNRSNTHGRAVCTKSEIFSDADDREIAQRYLHAVRELEKYLLIRQAQTRDHYELTNCGWQISRKVVAPVPTAIVSLGENI
jgi:hypothetical protein